LAGRPWPAFRPSLRDPLFDVETSRSPTRSLPPTIAGLDPQRVVGRGPDSGRRRPSSPVVPVLSPASPRTSRLSQRLGGANPPGRVRFDGSRHPLPRPRETAAAPRRWSGRTPGCSSKASSCGTTSSSGPRGVRRLPPAGPPEVRPARVGPRSRSLRSTGRGGPCPAGRISQRSTKSPRALSWGDPQALPPSTSPTSAPRPAQRSAPLAETVSRCASATSFTIRPAVTHRPPYRPPRPRWRFCLPVSGAGPSPTSPRRRRPGSETWRRHAFPLRAQASPPTRHP